MKRVIRTERSELPNVVYYKETLLQKSPSKEQSCFLVKILIKPVYLFRIHGKDTFEEKLTLRLSTCQEGVTTRVTRTVWKAFSSNATVYRNQTSRVHCDCVDLIGSAMMDIRPHLFFISFVRSRPDLQEKPSYSISICSQIQSLLYGAGDYHMLSRREIFMSNLCSSACIFSWKDLCI